MNEPFQEYELPGVGTVIDPQGEPGYRVRLPSGEVTAYPAASGEPSPANAAADIAHAIANPPTLPVPAEVTRYRLIVALRREWAITEGALYALFTILETKEQRETARDAFENASVFKRAHPLLTAVAQLNGKTAAEMDDLFRAAAAYTDLD